MDTHRENSANSTASTTSDSEGDEQDEPFSLQENTTEDALASFRTKWQEEITSPRHHVSEITECEENGNCESLDDDARLFFLKGIEMEKTGESFQAIHFYKKAVQIDEDIEFKLYNGPEPNGKEGQESMQKENRITRNNDFDQSDSDDEVIEDGHLLRHIQKKMTKVYAICSPKFEQSATHISALPVELILYILRWVVSSDLDLHTLEIFGRVCRGFYFCARDPEIWHSACLRAWGLNCGTSPGSFGSWRNMFIERTRLNFNGCYISKTTYIRYGENSFQDQYYQPWHSVAYYRYLRFFPEGIALMLTSADEPSQCVGQLKSCNARQPVMIGYYRLKDDTVTLVIQRQENKVITSLKKPTNRRDLHESAEQTLHIELQIKSHKRKKHAQLIWSHYSVFTRTKRGDESTCTFDLAANRFPPLWFSRVKSYTSESEMPLI